VSLTTILLNHVTLSTRKEVILNYMKAKIKDVWTPFNLKNILFQNGSIEDTKLGAYI
jgi:hypothetical protein